MRLILIAHWIEACALIEYLEAIPLPGSEGPLWNHSVLPCAYSYSHGTIILTDLGAPAAVAALAQHYPGHREVWNVGFAGALSPDMDLGTLYPIREVDFALPHYPHSSIARHAWPSVPLQTSGSRLLSTASPIHDPTEKMQWATRGYDLVDMEGYAIAHLAKRLSLPCTLWKIVSDTPKQSGSATIQEWAPILAARLSTLFETTHATEFRIAMHTQFST